MKLVEVADVVVDNFSQGVTKRLGIDHESLVKVNSKIITCSISGFGDTEINRPAYDNIVQGYSAPCPLLELIKIIQSNRESL